MLAISLRRVPKGCIFYTGIVRYLTTQEVATALRPFYFSVHPDLFGQFPKERAVNEESLKRLSEYVTSLQKTGNARPTDVIFFVRRQNESTSTSTDGMKEVKIELSSKTLRDTVVAVLGACGLPLDYLNSIPLDTTGGFFRPVKWHPSYYAASGKPDPDQRLHKPPPQQTLRSWLRLNIARSRENVDAIHHIQEDIDRLCTTLHSSLGLREIRWDSVWGISHFRGCLKSFYRLYSEHPHVISSVLKDRTLLFSNTTGVSRLGEIVLSSEDVPTAWMKLLLSVRGYDAVLERLPSMEQTLSNLFHGISVVRQERSHSHVMAEDYELLLNKLLNSLRRCQDHVTRTFLNSDLSGLELVVQAENGPLALSNTGSFLVPASAPGTIVVDFINAHKAEAYSILKDIDSCLREEEESIQECLQELELKDISKDESVTPQQMISCCQRLCQESWRFAVALHQASVRISHYYTVMQDGQICIPWDWVGDNT